MSERDVKTDAAGQDHARTVTQARPKRTAKPRASGRSLRGMALTTANQVTGNPIAALFGAAAVSAGLALLLPSSRRESEVLGEVADKLGEAAREATDSVVSAGRSQVEGLAQSALADVGSAVVQAVGAGPDS